MVLSDKDPKEGKIVKQTIMAAVGLILIWSMIWGAVEHTTGVNVKELCMTDKDTKKKTCIENDEAKEGISSIFLYGSLLVSGIAGGSILYSWVKY